MFQTLFNVLVAAVVGGLVFVTAFFDGGSVGTAMFERTKWVGEYFAVGSSEQLQVDSDGDLTSSGTITANGAVTVNGMLTASPTVVSTTTIGGNGMVLAQADLLAGGYYTVNVNQAADFTYTLPASSTLTSFLANAGDQTRVCFNNATTVPDIELVFVSGTGIDLEVATGTSVLERVGGGDNGCIDFFRKPNTDLNAVFWSFDDSD